MDLGRHWKVNSSIAYTCLNASYCSSYILSCGWHSNSNSSKWNKTFYKWVNGTLSNLKKQVPLCVVEDVLDTSVFQFSL